MGMLKHRKAEHCTKINIPNFISIFGGVKNFLLQNFPNVRRYQEKKKSLAKSLLIYHY